MFRRMFHKISNITFLNDKMSLSYHSLAGMKSRPINECLHLPFIERLWLNLLKLCILRGWVSGEEDIHFTKGLINSYKATRIHQPSRIAYFGLKITEYITINTSTKLHIG